MVLIDSIFGCYLLDHNTFGLEFNSTLLGTTEHIALNVLNVAWHSQNSYSR